MIECGETADLERENARACRRFIALPLITALARVQTLRAQDDCPTRVARGIDNWKSLTRYDNTRNAALTRALGHVCDSGGVGATG